MIISQNKNSIINFCFAWIKSLRCVKTNDKNKSKYDQKDKNWDGM